MVLMFGKGLHVFVFFVVMLWLCCGYVVVMFLFWLLCVPFLSLVDHFKLMISFSLHHCIWHINNG